MYSEVTLCGPNPHVPMVVAETNWEKSVHHILQKTIGYPLWYMFKIDKYQMSFLFGSNLPLCNYKTVFGAIIALESNINGGIFRFRRMLTCPGGTNGKSVQHQIKPSYNHLDHTRASTSLFTFVDRLGTRMVTIHESFIGPALTICQRGNFQFAILGQFLSSAKNRHKLVKISKNW